MRLAVQSIYNRDTDDDNKYETVLHLDVYKRQILSNGLALTLTGEIISRPYINLTLQLMNDFGAKAKWLNEYQDVYKRQLYVYSSALPVYQQE